MNLTQIGKSIKFKAAKALKLKGYGISILVPFHCYDKQGHRAKNWEWLAKYWKKQLPGAEVIVGIDSEVTNNIPFSKSKAVNDAASRAHGDIFVIVDADGYISVESILHCCKEIRHAKKRNKKLWFVPYRKFHRLTEESSKLILDSSPATPYKFSNPPPNETLLNTEIFNGVSGSSCGHRYGALIQIMPREAFEEIGGWDTRFRGWGGEDYAAMRAVDTLYWPHKTLPIQVFHIWHPFLTNNSVSKNRLWENQGSNNNNSLSHRYYLAQSDVEKMKNLMNEWKDNK